MLNVALRILKQVHNSVKEFDFDKILYADSAKEVDGMLADVIANAKNYERNIRKEERKEGKMEEKKEIAEKMLLKNKPISEIMEFTELTEKQIREIEKTI